MYPGSHILITGVGEPGQTTMSKVKDYLLDTAIDDTDCDYDCSNCLGTGEVEVMGDGDGFEWEVIGIKRCTACL